MLSILLFLYTDTNTYTHTYTYTYTSTCTYTYAYTCKNACNRGFQQGAPGAQGIHAPNQVPTSGAILGAGGARKCTCTISIHAPHQARQPAVVTR